MLIQEDYDERMEDARKKLTEKPRFYERWDVEAGLRSIKKKLASVGQNVDNEKDFKFDESAFLEEAQNMFIQVNECVVRGDDAMLRRLTTNLAYQARCVDV